MAGLSALSYGLIAASAGLAAYSSYQGGKAAQKAYKAQAEQYEANARAKALETSINEDALRKERRARLARMSAAQGEAGLEGGTATGAYMSSFRAAEQDALNLRYEGMSQWANYKNQAALNRFYGKQAFKQGQLGAWTSGIGGLAQMGSLYAMNYTPKSMPEMTKLSGTTGKYLATASPSELRGYRGGIFADGIPWG